MNVVSRGVKKIVDGIKVHSDPIDTGISVLMAGMYIFAAFLLMPLWMPLHLLGKAYEKFNKKRKLK